MWEPQSRYHDADVVALDASFNRYRVLGGIDRLYTGCRWAEGPVWFGDGRYGRRRLAPSPCSRAPAATPMAIPATCRGG